MAKAYREKLAEKGVTGFRDAAGRDWDLRRYTEMVARTTTREVMIQGTANRLLEHGHDLAVIIGGVGSNTCEVCKAWVGRTVSLTGKTPGYPTLDDARAEGLLHPNCTHNIATAMTFESEIAKAKYVNDHEKKVQSALSYMDDLWHNMPYIEKEAIQLYTDRTVNKAINDYLFSNIDVLEEIPRTIGNLESVLERASLPEDMILFRGVHPRTWELMQSDGRYVQPGRIIEYRGFMSTSHDLGTANRYATDTEFQDMEKAVIEVLAPRGTKALAIEKHSLSPDDREILIKRETKFRVVEARKDGNTMRLIWEAMP